MAAQASVEEAHMAVAVSLGQNTEQELQRESLAELLSERRTGPSK